MGPLALLGGEAIWSCEEPATVADTGLCVPKRICAPEGKFDPLIVTEVPPMFGPSAGRATGASASDAAGVGRVPGEETSITPRPRFPRPQANCESSASSMA